MFYIQIVLRRHLFRQVPIEKRLSADKNALQVSKVHEILIIFPIMRAFVFSMTLPLAVIQLAAPRLLKHKPRDLRFLCWIQSGK